MADIGLRKTIHSNRFVSTSSSWRRYGYRVTWSPRYVAQVEYDGLMLLPMGPMDANDGEDSPPTSPLLPLPSPSRIPSIMDLFVGRGRKNGSSSSSSSNS